MERGQLTVQGLLVPEDRSKHAFYDMQCNFKVFGLVIGKRLRISEVAKKCRITSAWSGPRLKSFT